MRPRGLCHRASLFVVFQIWQIPMTADAARGARAAVVYVVYEAMAVVTVPSTLSQTVPNVYSDGADSFRSEAS